MIISHKYKFIFIKTVKTASTSLEIALSQFCDENDIISPISLKDEAIRTALGFRNRQNWLLPFSSYQAEDWCNLLMKKQRASFYNHAPASFIKAHIPEDIWNSYYKFCFERNPWDKAISWFYWQKEAYNIDSPSTFIQAGHASNINAFDLYSINGEIAVNKVFLYEDLDDALTELSKRLNLPFRPTLPRAKSDIRKDRRHYREILSPADRDKIAAVYAREIAHFNYQW